MSAHLRGLVVTNMYPSAESRVRGRFVRDQVEALRALPEVEVELFAFRPGGTRTYLRAARELRRRYAGEQFDVIHAHFGLTAWPSLALRGAPHIVTLHGTDLSHPRSGPITRAALPFVDAIVIGSDELIELVPKRQRDKLHMLSCGVDLNRFIEIDRTEARARLGLDPGGRYILFPADPERPEKRFDRASELAERSGVTLLTLGDVDPEAVPLYVNAANAVTVTSEREGFGLAFLEALACNVPVLSTEVGIAPKVLDGVAGCLCAPFELDRWLEALTPHLDGSDPRVTGRGHAEPYATTVMAERLVELWRKLASGSVQIS